MRRPPGLRIAAVVALSTVLSLLMVGLAQAFPASAPDNTGMVDFPGAGGSSNAVAVRTIAQFGANIWVGGRFTEIDDGNGNKVQNGDAANLAAFSSTTGLVASGVHIPLVTSSVGDPEVYDSSVGSDGNLYFAGNFDAVDGQVRHNVAAVNATTGVLTSFAPNAASANAILATPSAIYVGTGKLLSFQLNGTATPGYTAPIAIVDAGIRGHPIAPQFRDMQLQGNTVVAACQCDSVTDAAGTRTVKAVVEIDAATGNWVNWRPTLLPDSSAAFGISVILHAFPGTGSPTVYLAAGGSDFTAAYDFSTGTQKFKTDTSGSSQAIAWYEGTLVIGGHYDWTESPSAVGGCGDNTSPNTSCYHTPKLSSMNATTGAVLLDPSNANKPWNPGICCKYNGVWALLTGNDGQTLHVGGEFTQVGGTWSGSGTNWTLTGASNQQFYARLGGPTSTLLPLTVQKTSVAGATGTVTSTPSGISCDANCTGSGPTDFNKNATVTLTASASAGATFTGWSSADPGFNCPGPGDCAVTMDTARTVVANFAGISFQLGVSKTGAGTGTVSSAPSGIACGATCSSFFAQNAVVTLTATPGPNSSFTSGGGWSGGGCSGTGTCVVTMDAAKNVTANFATTNQTLTVVRTTGTTGMGQGSIISTPAGISCPGVCVKSFNVGSVTLTATAAGGSIFNGWSGGGCSGLTPMCVVTMDAAKTVTGDFEQARNVTLTMAGAGGGTVTSDPSGLSCSVSCAKSFAQGSTVTLTATPNGTSVFTGWSGSGCTGTGQCVLVMTGGKPVTATFQPAQLLTAIPAGSGGGTMTSDLTGINCGLVCAANYLTGTVVTLSAAPDANSTFTGWTGEGCTGTATCVVTMSQARNVTATFTLVQRALTVHAGGQGTVTDNPGPINCVGPTPTGTCNATYQHGTDVQLVASPSANWSFSGWSGDCTGTDICVVSMTAVRDVTATFDRISRTVTVAKDGSGTGLVTSDLPGIACGSDCAEGYNQGDAVTLTAAADGGSTFIGWSGDCSGSGACNLTVDAAKNVTATFELLHNLTVVTAGAGTGTVTSDVGGIACPASCSANGRTHNTLVILTAASDPGSAFAGWSGGGCSGTASTCDVTMDSDKTVTATFEPSVALTVTMGGTGTGTVTTPPANEINCPSACTYAFPQNSSVTLHPVPTGTAVFQGWSSADAGFACPDTGDCTVTMDMARNVTATFGSTQPLHITRAGAGGGTVTSTPAGIDCGAVCDVSFLQGSNVLLHAEGGPNAAFSGWSGDVVSCPGSADCTVTMDQARSVTATFSPIYHQLAVTKTGGSGTGTVTSLAPNMGVNCGATCFWDFTQGTSVVLHAAADVNSTFIGWSDAGCPGMGDCTVTMDIAKSVNATFDVIGGGTTTLKDNDPAVAYNGWFGVADPAADGLFYRMSNVKNDKATWKSPATTSITWVTRTGPDQGKASVTIDGVAKGTVDLYAASAAASNKVYSGLSNAVHTVVIKVLHTKNAASSGYNVRLDAFVVGATTTQESDTAIQWDTWKSTTKSNATDATYRSASAATATATVSFTGTSIDWKTTKGKAYGKASVTIDGIPKGTVDLYQAVTAWQSTISYTGLSAGPHTMVIQVLGQKNASATSTKVVVDGFVVHS